MKSTLSMQQEKRKVASLQENEGGSILATFQH
jgi:hypothetical protein